MERPTASSNSEDIFAASVPNVVEMTATVNQSLATSDINACSVRNTAIIARK